MYSICVRFNDENVCITFSSLQTGLMIVKLLQTHHAVQPSVVGLAEHAKQYIMRISQYCLQQPLFVDIGINAPDYRAYIQPQAISRTITAVTKSQKLSELLSAQTNMIDPQQLYQLQQTVRMADGGTFRAPQAIDNPTAMLNRQLTATMKLPYPIAAVQQAGPIPQPSSDVIWLAARGGTLQGQHQQKRPQYLAKYNYNTFDLNLITFTPDGKKVFKLDLDTCKIVLFTITQYGTRVSALKAQLRAGLKMTSGPILIQNDHAYMEHMNTVNKLQQSMYHYRDIQQQFMLLHLVYQQQYSQRYRVSQLADVIMESQFRDQDALNSHLNNLKQRAYSKESSISPPQPLHAKQHPTRNAQNLPPGSTGPKRQQSQQHDTCINMINETAKFYDVVANLSPTRKVKYQNIVSQLLDEISTQTIANTLLLIMYSMLEAQTTEISVLLTTIDSYMKKSTTTAMFDIPICKINVLLVHFINSVVDATKIRLRPIKRIEMDFASFITFYRSNVQIQFTSREINSIMSRCSRTVVADVKSRLCGGGLPAKVLTSGTL